MKGKFAMPRKRRPLVLIVAAVTGLLVACAPNFASGSALNATPSGSGAVLSWSAASVTTTGRTIDSYRIDVDGTEVARMPRTDLGCRLHGLRSGSHTVSVTAYDSGGEWSGSQTTGGTLTAQVTAPAPIADDVHPSDPRTTPGCFGSLAGTYTGSGERYECLGMLGYPEMTECDPHTPRPIVAFQLSGPCDGVGACGLSTDIETFLYDAIDEVCGEPDGSGYWFSYIPPIGVPLMFRVTFNGAGDAVSYRGKASIPTYVDPPVIREIVEDSSGTRTSTAATATSC